MQEKVMRNHMEERFGRVLNYSLTPPLPMSLNIELNNTCNHKCSFCSFHGPNTIHQIKPSVMEFEFANRILLQAKELGIGRKELGFYLAGEPLLYDRLTEVIAYAKQLGFPYTFLTTNGTLATTKRIEELVDAGLDSIRFSVNGADRETYREFHGVDQFDKVYQNIRHLYEYREANHLSIAISLSCVITKKTKNMQEKVRKVFSGYVDDILFIPVMLDRLDEKKFKKEDYEVFEDSDTQTIAKIDPEYICPLLFDTMYIGSGGEVMPCCRAYDFDCSFGNLHDNFDLKAAWYGESYDRYRKIFLEGASDKGTICEGCLLRRKSVGRFFMEESDS